MILNPMLSPFDSRRFAGALRKGLLNLLGADDEGAPTLPPSAQSILDYAGAVKAGADADRLTTLLAAVAVPGPAMRMALVQRLLVERRYDEAADGLAAIPESDLTPAQKLQAAELHARRGALDRAESLIESAYAADPRLKDGYARCGWHYYWPRKEYDKVVEWMERDAGRVATHA
jgi:hypothetical protein